MTATDNYQEYTSQAIENFALRDAESRYLLVNAVGDLRAEKVLDVGCGAGQELLPFMEKTSAFCVGIDVAEELGKVAVKFFQRQNKAAFVRSRGEILPFADESFDVVLCRVALPYMNNRHMNNRRTIAEVARVLRPNGIFLLKTHALAFYLGMIRRRWRTFSVKQIAYPLICLAGGTWHFLTGRQPQNGFWAGKKVFQTEGFLRRELAKNNLRIEGCLPDTNPETPSFVIKKK